MDTAAVLVRVIVQLCTGSNPGTAAEMLKTDLIKGNSQLASLLMEESILNPPFNTVLDEKEIKLIPFEDSCMSTHLNISSEYLSGMKEFVTKKSLHLLFSLLF